MKIKLKDSNDDLFLARGNTEVGLFDKITGSKIESTTYSNLVTLKTNGNLSPGTFYRITDYVTTTAQTGTQSAGHAFDIIVLATENNVLSENAWAALHSGDTYFANCNLDAWEIKYRLENDTDNFAWASTNGKGVIYYMKDEWDNEAPYDFKNIQFARYWITADTSTASLKNTWLGCYDLDGTTKVPSTATFDATPKYMYTFTKLDDMISTATVSDYSVVLGSDSKSYCYGNVIGLWLNGGVVTLNSIVLFATSTTDVMCGNTFGNSCYNNSFGDNCSSNSFGSYCYGNSFGNNCSSNSFGNHCYGNSIGNSCGYNSFGNICYSNSFGNSCNSNSFGNNCRSNSFRNGCVYNSFGNMCYSITLRRYCQSNSFGNYCNRISFSKDYMYNNIVENGNRYITVTSTQTTSSSNVLSNFTISQGVNTTTTTKTISHDSVNDTTKTIYCTSIRTVEV